MYCVSCSQQIHCVSFLFGYLYHPVLGSFDTDQAGSGSVACLNIYNGVYQSSQLLAFSQCDVTGDIFHLDILSGRIYGDVTTNTGSMKRVYVW